VKAWRWATLGGLGAVVVMAVAARVTAPGYMDADYYFATARELTSGRPWTEPFLWNYLDDPSGLPHPAHLYWSPLASLLAAGFMAAFGNAFAVAQIPFILIAAGLPWLTAAIGLWSGSDEPRAWLAGCLAALPGFFHPFLVSSDTFGLYALLGAAALWGMAAAPRQPPGRWLLVGLAIGLCGLTRADGLLLLVPGLVAALGFSRTPGRAAAILLSGCALVLLPWWLRNVSVAGTPLPPGAGRTVWSVTYDDLFAYPASLLTPQRWLASGWPAILQARMGALGQNLKTLIGVNGLVFLAPLMALGAWRRRDQLLVRLTGIYLLVLVGVMTLVFPFAGGRGGLFHSSTATMPILWMLAAEGLQVLVVWGERHRGWQPRQAFSVLGGGALVLAAGVTLALTWSRLTDSEGRPTWGASQRTYAEVGGVVAEHGAPTGPIAVNNPPGFWLAAGMPAVVIPDGTTQVLRAVVERYDVAWVVLERNHPSGLSDLYADPAALPWLHPVERLVDAAGNPVHVLRVTEPSEAAP
jgi:hypothetical protein